MATRPHSLSIFLLSLSLSILSLSATSHFEGFDAEEDENDPLETLDFPLPTCSPPPTVTQSDPTPPLPDPNPNPSPLAESQPSDDPSVLIEWDEDEFEGFEQTLTETTLKITRNENETVTESGSEMGKNPNPEIEDSAPRSYLVEIICCSFLIVFVINFFVGRNENEGIALAWVAKFAAKGSIFDKNFSLLGVGEGKDEDSPLLLKEGRNIFKFYASGRRYCQGMLATMELKSRHDLISRAFNAVVKYKDEITFEVYMNEEAMDHVVFAMAKRKVVKGMLKDSRDLQRFAGMVVPPGGRKWVVEELGVVSESKEVAGDLITETVLEQVFGDKAFEKYGKDFISVHFSDQHVGRHRKVLVFKFALPNAKKMEEMTCLVALVPYYIDLIGRYKLSSQARAKTEAARQKVAQEIYKEFQYARQEVLQKKKAERRKLMEEAEAKLSAEAVRKKEAKERARQMKKAMPKVKMNRAH